jgi:hypothetical protein
VERLEREKSRPVLLLPTGILQGSIPCGIVQVQFKVGYSRWSAARKLGAAFFVDEGPRTGKAGSNIWPKKER